MTDMDTDEIFGGIKRITPVYTDNIIQFPKMPVNAATDIEHSDMDNIIQFPDKLFVLIGS